MVFFYIYEFEKHSPDPSQEGELVHFRKAIEFKITLIP